MQIEAKFRLPEATTLAIKYHLERIYPIFEKLRQIDPNAKDWLLQGDNREEALLYTVYESDGRISNAVEAVLETRYRNKSVRAIGIWNGEEEKTAAISSGYIYNNLGVIPSSFSIEYPKKGAYRLSNILGLYSVISCVVEAIEPKYVSIAPNDYFAQQVFKDRPGVGWMLYLPQILNARQVPEARALIPVMHEKKQSGTIIVSVTDAPFDMNNPEHIKIANAIEIRLVDQDLLPRFADL